MSRVLSVTYDLVAPGRNYSPLYEAIKKAGGNSWCRPTESQWLIPTNTSCAAVRDALAAHIDRNDKLFVVEVGTNWASWGLAQPITDWLHRNLS